MSSPDSSQPSRFSHKRADTYEGPQMSFQFPSTSDLIKQEELEASRSIQSPALSGPLIEPYYKSHPSSPISSTPHERAASVYEQFSTSSQASGLSFINSEATGSGSIPTIPTKSNVSFPITDNISVATAPPLPAHQQHLFTQPAYPSLLVPLDQPQQHQAFQSLHHNETLPLPSSPDELNAGVELPGRRVVRRSASLKSPTKNSDHLSLFSKSTLTRSKAIRHKVGWLSKLKVANKKLYSHLKKSWRRIKNKSKRTMLSFKTRFSRNKAVEKTKISLPLERSQGKTIQDIKRDISDWYVPETVAKVPRVPSVKRTPENIRQTKQRVSSLASIQASINKISGSPSDFPGNRITSNPLIQKYIRQEELKKRLSSAPMTLTEHHYKDLSSVSGGQSNTSHNILMEGDDALVFEYLKVFLSNVIAQRINHKLEMSHIENLSKKKSNRESIQISVPELEYDNESLAGSEYCGGVHSDYDTQFSLSDYEGDSDAEEEEEQEAKNQQQQPTTSHVDIENQSETSTTYYSVYNEDEEDELMLSDTLIRYQQTYVTGSLKRKDTLKTIRRSSTLPGNIKFKNHLQNNEVKIKNAIVHNSRYL